MATDREMGFGAGFSAITKPNTPGAPLILHLQSAEFKDGYAAGCDAGRMALSREREAKRDKPAPEPEKAWFAKAWFKPEPKEAEANTAPEPDSRVSNLWRMLLESRNQDREHEC